MVSTGQAEGSAFCFHHQFHVDRSAAPHHQQPETTDRARGAVVVFAFVAAEVVVSHADGTCARLAVYAGDTCRRAQTLTVDTHGVAAGSIPYVIHVCTTRMNPLRLAASCVNFDQVSIAPQWSRCYDSWASLEAHVQRQNHVASEAGRQVGSWTRLAMLVSGDARRREGGSRTLEGKAEEHE